MNLKITLNQGLALLLQLSLGWGVVTFAHAAPQPKITLTKAVWAAKSQRLTVKGRIRHAPATDVDLFELNGAKLGSVSSSPFSLSIPGDQLTDIPCAVRAQAGAIEAVKPVAGNPNKACKQTPKCRILEPTGPITVNANEAVSFKAQATLAKSAKPQFEWDFGGGSMGIDDSTSAKIDSFQRASGTEATVRFILNDSRYRVRLSAVDGSIKAQESKPYRCEDSVEITVGSPPAETPDLTAVLGAARQSPPKLEKDEQGNPSGHKDDLVVLPYEDLTMQCSEDMRQAPGAMLGSEFHYGSLNAVVYKKDLKSPVLAAYAVKLRDAAGVNPLDPVGPDSINSTSQNWPTGADLRTAGVPMDTAKIRKTDRWDSSLLGPDVGENLDSVISRGNYEIVRTPDQGITLLAAQADAFGMPPSLWRLTRAPACRALRWTGCSIFASSNGPSWRRRASKKAVVRVSAGSSIGCDTCHTVELSCTGSPAGDACGTASSKTTAATNPAAGLRGRTRRRCNHRRLRRDGGLRLHPASHRSRWKRGRADLRPRHPARHHEHRFADGPGHGQRLDSDHRRQQPAVYLHLPYHGA
ncbi:MAG: hypothetical protein FIA97_03415 [Methylococcaceae bacterium]|nr:hypothetical protein [Methylococcaceae bacterium]